MMNSRIFVESLSSSDLRSATRELVRTSHGVDAALLVHLGEIDERKLYLDWPARGFTHIPFRRRHTGGATRVVACSRIRTANRARAAT
jgi:hypothetical protein